MNYHSTMGSNTFMKFLRLEKAGHDLDEIKSLPTAEWKRPWWVQWSVEPTIEVDWDRKERFDETKVIQGSFDKYVGEEESKRVRKMKVDKTKAWVLENRPNYNLQARALDIAVRQGAVGTSFVGFMNEPDKVKDGWGGHLMSPETLGVPRYVGTPEENSLMIRAALKTFGASQVGFLELNDRIKKLIYSVDHDGKKIDFEDVDRAYETEDRRVVPKKAKWVIVFSIQMSEELIKRTNGRAPTPFSASATGLAYARSRMIFDDLQTFLHVLGYQGLTSEWFNGQGIAPALGIMAGLGELSRLNRMVSPEYGPNQRVFRVITDLPVAPTRPINAGIMRFCRTCKKCAQECPSGCLSMDTEPTWEIKGPWSNPGHRTYFEDSVKCMAYWLKSSCSCATCFAVCPFSKKDKSFMHSFVAATIAKTPVFNHFFTVMDGLMGYDKPKDPESWWRHNMPSHGIDANRLTDVE